MSRLHRWLVREHQWLQEHTEHSCPDPISDSQLRRLLASLDYTTYNQINASFFGWLSAETGVWQSADGKELRGSIDGVNGQKRGEVLVRLVGHEDGLATVAGFYNGAKESERTLIEGYVSAQPIVAGQGLSLDALHLTPTLLTKLEEHKAMYVVGLKGNQSELLRLANGLSQGLPFEEYSHLEKGHGRVEQRSYQFYQVEPMALEDRWALAGLQTMIRVERHRLTTKTNTATCEVAWFVSNLGVSKSISIAGAIRNHWQIEADHYVRDTTAGEDALRCGEPNRMRSIASLLNVGVNLLRGYDRKGNLRACWEDCCADRTIAHAVFKPV